MKLLFKALVNSGNPTIGQTDFKEHYPFAEGSMAFNELQPKIRQATRTYILPYIGLPMYEKLSTDFQEGELDTEQELLVSILQDAIAHYTIYSALPYLPFVICSNGIQKTSPTEGSTSPTHGERKDTRWNAHLDADRYLDEAINILENTEGDYYQPFHDYATKNFRTSIFFKTAESLNEHLNIQSNRRAFAALVPYLRKVEESSELEILIGIEFFNDLKNTETNLKKHLVRKIQKWVAQKALHESVPFLTLVIEGDGFKIVSRGDGIEERNGLKHQQHENAILRLQNAAREKSEKYYDELLAFLWKNKDEFPLWKDSDYYMSSNSEETSTSVITTGEGAVFLKF
jgi:hypothetical protein